MSGLDPAVASARLAIQAVLRAAAPERAGTTGGLPDHAAADRATAPAGTTDDALVGAPLVLVACSGGPDSLALAAQTAIVAPRCGWRAGAVIVDHQLQPGSGRIAATAADQCRGLGLDPIRLVPVTVGTDGGMEAAARSARYQALDAQAAADRASLVLLGHTLDDQAETVLLRLLRGSGAGSLSGMRPARGIYRRPFLGLRRSETGRICAQAGLEPWHDPTNQAADGPLRSQLRASVLPAIVGTLGDAAIEALARSADLLREDDDLLQAWSAQVAERLTITKGQRIELDCAALGRQPPAIRSRVLRRAALAATVPPGRLTSAHIDALDRLVTQWHGQGPLDLPAVIARRDCGTLCLFPRVAPAAAEHRPNPQIRTTKEQIEVEASDMGKDLEKVLLTAEEIDAKLSELAAQIDRDYADKNVLLVGVLKGAVMVMADLSRKLHAPVEMDWMAVSSYGSGTKSSGVVRILKDLETDLMGRHVLVVEDIVDSGLTLSWLLANLRSRGTASVEVAALLRKPAAAKVPVDVRYVGFDIPNEFVVGYGLDFAEKYRTLPCVGTLAPHVYAS